MDGLLSLLARLLVPDFMHLRDVLPILLSDDSDRDPVLIRNENYLEVRVPHYDEVTFLSHFRVSRNVVERITTLYIRSPDYKEDAYGRFGKITAVNQVIIFLWYAAHQTASFRDVGDRFNVSISALHGLLKRLTYFVSSSHPNNENCTITPPPRETIMEK